MSPETRRQILNSLPAGSVTIRWHGVDLRQFGSFATLSHISKITYARLLLPQKFDESPARILYLDADLLVLGDLEALWETQLEGAVLGAVRDDTLDRALKSSDPGWVGLPRVADYFNAGVLLIDLQRWRAERISEKALAYLTQYPHSPFSDQDALNVACDRHWKPLEPRWNTHNHWETSICDLPSARRPVILHFVAKAKPWDARARNINARLYDSIRSRTRFARTPMDRLLDLFRRALARGERVWHRLDLHC
jgi:lipopolysaccharide biosynthesis glycosyltransferase